MFPDFTFLGMDLYVWCLMAGVIAALVVARVYADRLGIPAKLQNLVYITGFFAILLGYGSAVLFQAVYNAVETGKFVLNSSTGATFYGGFIGGAIVFLSGYFLVGGKLLGKLPLQYAKEVTSFASCAVAIAHCIGRLGCLCVGCCYGRVTDAWYGMYLPAVGAKVVPTQLFELIFLFILFFVLSFVLFRTKISCLGIYLSSYAVFRFCIEFLRDDHRGEFVGAVSPSQFWAIVLFLIGVAVLLLFLLLDRRKKLAKAQTE